MNPTTLRDAVKNNIGILQRVCQPICKRLSAAIKRPVFIFFSPPFLERDYASVRYYGLDDPSSTELEAQNLLTKLYKDNFENSTSIDLNQLVAFIQQIETLVKKDGLSPVKLYDSAIMILTNAEVRFSQWELQESNQNVVPPKHEDKCVLLDFALELTTWKDNESKMIYPHQKATQAYLRTTPAFGEFHSNDEYIGEEADCPLLIADSYLTRKNYLKVSEPFSRNDNSSSGTLLPFVAECLYFSNGWISTANHDTGRDDLVNFSLAKYEDLEKLSQVHLPIASLGQFRGSVCWICINNARPENEQEKLAAHFNETTQHTLSETLSVAILELFVANLDDALKHRDIDQNDRLGYFQRLGITFGDLYWCYQMDFYQQDTHVASGSPSGKISILNERTKPRAKGNGKVIELSGFDGIKHVITIDFSQYSDSAKHHFLRTALEFDRVELRTCTPIDTERFLWSADLIIQKIEQVVQHHKDTGIIHQSEIAFMFGHSLKNELTERDAPALKSELINSYELHARLVRNLQKLIRTPAVILASGTHVAEVNDIIQKLQQCAIVDEAIFRDTFACLESDNYLYGKAELFRVIAKISRGRLPRIWLNHNFNGTKHSLISEPELKIWMHALRAHIVNIGHIYSQKIIKLGHELEICEVVADHLIRQSQVIDSPTNVPPFQSGTIQNQSGTIQNAALLTIFAPLTELVRNALKYLSDINHIEFFLAQSIPRKLQFCFEIAVVPQGKIQVNLWNPIVKDTVSKSSSITKIYSLSRFLKGIEMSIPYVTQFGPLNTQDGYYAKSQYWVSPSEIEFEEGHQ